ncbi:erythroblast NAD(P)(+)--arginine ADP-ribosyltransferase-like [Oenanthe melanoleuca]|uniref:erythroblast NAD(P)(+)--arginine ADP-ribosyltransferase-like n=1 Tax=Oenanthe melanoleuca TaxID=2939378 RepID=UPI0024C13106|nr:erythroblast NAD(P)(+)--arginine ADP-ribosyltransferase-like [Oenanthe melanoleuca]
MALLALTLALLAMTVATMAITMRRLDMALNSFDDQYRGCGPAMKAELPALNRSELQNNRLFAKGWSEAVDKWWNTGSPVSPLSSSDQAISIMAYHEFDLHNAFNEDVSVSGRSPQAYRDKFQFKTLHFLLTDAVATLRAAQKEQGCHCVVHVDPKYKFNNANPGDIVRFGKFALSTRCNDDIERLRTPTVFQVQTCHSVDISAFIDNPMTDVVLIPPFEKFKVTNVIDYGEKVEILLDSIGTYSKYNCEWLKGGSISQAPYHLGGLLLATTVLAMATGIL